MISPTHFAVDSHGQPTNLDEVNAKLKVGNTEATLSLFMHKKLLPPPGQQGPTEIRCTKVGEEKFSNRVSGAIDPYQIMEHAANDAMIHPPMELQFATPYSSYSSNSTNADYALTSCRVQATYIGPGRLPPWAEDLPVFSIPLTREVIGNLEPEGGYSTLNSETWTIELIGGQKSERFTIPLNTSSEPNLIPLCNRTAWLKVGAPLLPVEVNVNDTADAKDDMVRKEQKIGSTAWRQWIPCTVKIPESGPGKTITSIGVKAESGTMKFAQDSSTPPTNTTEGAANVAVTLDAQGQGKFWITGITQSANKGDAKLQIRKNGATGDVLATQPMTVFWFTGDTRAANAPDSAAATNCSRYQNDGHWTYGLPVDSGIRLKAQAKVSPTGLDTSVPQIADWKWNIVQNVSSTRTWHVTRTENNQTTKKVGTVTVPRSLDVINPGGFLFDPAATDSFNADGATVDTNDAPTTQADKVDLDTQKNTLDPFGKRFDWAKSTMADSFTLWGGLVKFDAQNTPTEFVPVFQNTWSINADSSQANQKATPSAGQGAQPTTAPIVQPPTAISQILDSNFNWADEQ